MDSEKFGETDVKAGKDQEKVTDFDEFSQIIEAEIQETDHKEAQTGEAEMKTGDGEARAAEVCRKYLDRRTPMRVQIYEYMHKEHDSEDDIYVKTMLGRLKSPNQGKGNVWKELTEGLGCDYSGISSQTFGVLLGAILDSQPEEHILFTLNTLLQTSEFLEDELSESRIQMMFLFLTQKNSWAKEDMKADAFECLAMLVSSGFVLLGDDKARFIKLFFDECDKSPLFEEMARWIFYVKNKVKAFDVNIVKIYRNYGILTFYAALLSNSEEKNHIFGDIMNCLLSTEEEVKEAIKSEWLDLKSLIFGRKSRRLSVSLLEFFASVFLGSLTYTEFHRATATLLSEWYPWTVLEKEYGDLESCTHLIEFLKRNIKYKGNMTKGSHLLLDKLKKKYFADRVSSFKEILIEFNYISDHDAKGRARSRRKGRSQIKKNTC